MVIALLGKERGLGGEMQSYDLPEMVSFKRTWPLIVKVNRTP